MEQYSRKIITNTSWIRVVQFSNEVSNDTELDSSSLNVPLAWMAEIRRRLPTGAKCSIVSSQEDLNGKPFFSQVYVVDVLRAKWFSSRHVNVTETFYRCPFYD